MLAEALGRGATVVQTYGLTETASQVTTLSPAEAASRKLGSAGRPLLTTHLRIQDGEILVQGPTVAPGAADEDGWLHTGDLGRIDDEGFLYVTGRLGDLIVTGGENVLPTEVEEVLLRHPGRRRRRGGRARRRRVAGGGDGGRRAPRRGRGERRRAAQPLPAELAGYKVPKRIEFVDRAAADGVGEADAPGAAVIDRAAVDRWLDESAAAWRSYDRAAIGALFSEDAEVRYHPCDEPIRGRDAIVESCGVGGGAPSASTASGTYQLLIAAPVHGDQSTHRPRQTARAVGSAASTPSAIGC